MKSRRTLILLVIAVAAIAVLWFAAPSLFGGGSAPGPNATSAQPGIDDDLAAIQDAYDSQESNVQVHGTGTVERVLADDNEGDRHQRLILRLPVGFTVLIAHNIDVAPRLDGVAEGDTVEFFGEYEWSEEGGTVHWTHHDPAGSHEDGWLRWNGKVYE